jgi:hypothetical protein
MDSLSTKYNASLARMDTTVVFLLASHSRESRIWVKSDGQMDRVLLEMQRFTPDSVSDCRFVPRQHPVVLIPHISRYQIESLPCSIQISQIHLPVTRSLPRPPTLHKRIPSHKLLRLLPNDPCQIQPNQTPRGAVPSGRLCGCNSMDPEKQTRLPKQ